VLLVGILACSAAAAFAARREAELAGLRSDFVTSISHELRMPLAQILLFGETLSLDRARSQAERDEAADAIVRETQRLAGVVDNVLYFSRIEHHNLAVVTEPVDLAAFVDDTVADMRLLADDARIALDASVPPALVVQIDRGAFRRVLFDLVDNAIKYGPRGQRVTIAARERGGDLRPVRAAPARSQFPRRRERAWTGRGPGARRGARWTDLGRTRRIRGRAFRHRYPRGRGERNRDGWRHTRCRTRRGPGSAHHQSR